jgi:hypothetical protein
MRRLVKSAMAKLSIGLLGLAGLVAVGCGAEPFSLSLEGGILISQGSGGFPAGTGGDTIIVPGTGGSGSGGADGSGGAPGVPDAGTAADTSAVDMPSVADAAADIRRDVTAPRDATAEGPLTLFNCYVLKTYVLDAPYDAGARVFSLRDLRVYQCRPWPNSGWCSIGAYEPGGPLGFWPDAWVPLGYCE